MVVRVDAGIAEQLIENAARRRDTLTSLGMRKQLQFEQNIECTMKIASCESVLARFIYRARLILNLSLFFV